MPDTYIPRHISSVIEKASEQFSAIIVTGPRQVGKSTLLRTLYPELPYSTLDSITELDAARNNPEGYLNTKAVPVIIDEIQYAPDLFSSMKMIIDEAKLSGDRRTLFYATGSQRFHMMRTVSESLAGRAYVSEMLGLSQREIQRVPFTVPFNPTMPYIKQREAAGNIPSSGMIWHRILQGDLPELEAVPHLDISMFYDAYINTYIQRDVRDLSQIGDMALFMRFMRVVAHQCGRQLNKAAIARDLDVSEPTVNRWLSILEASGLIYLLKPYAKTVKKRLVKMPKLYFTNTGLACHLCDLKTEDSLTNSPLAGHLFENFVVGEILKSFLNDTGTYPELYYYRDSNGKEIDLLIPGEEGLHPVEVKSNSTPKAKDGEKFAVIDSVLGEKRLPGAIISLYDQVLPLIGNDLAIPVTMI